MKSDQELIGALVENERVANHERETADFNQIAEDLAVQDHKNAKKFKGAKPIPRWHASKHKGAKVRSPNAGAQRLKARRTSKASRKGNR